MGRRMAALLGRGFNDRMSGSWVVEKVPNLGPPARV